METIFDEHDNSGEKDIEILVDVLRRCFDAEKARYHLPIQQNMLYVEISGLQELTQDEIEEIAGPVLTELDLDFDEIMILPLEN